MPTDNPFALLLTWTCYGTWLPGDRRGYVSNTLRHGGGFVPKLNRPGMPYAVDDPYTRQRAAELQKGSTVCLAYDDARCAAESFVQASSERGWRVLRGAVMANHVHLVVAECPDDGPAVRRVLKGVSQAALSRRRGRPRRWWTHGGSDRYLHSERAILAACRYVAEQEGMLVGIVDGKVHRPPG
jgi:REP element-mobilizing transposase RayT